MQTIRAVFADAEGAKSAIGRLEVAGILPENITVSQDPVSPPRHKDDETVVTAKIDEAHVDKAVAILSGEGRVERANGRSA